MKLIEKVALYNKLTSNKLPVPTREYFESIYTKHESYHITGPGITIVAKLNQAHPHFDAENTPKPTYTLSVKTDGARGLPKSYTSNDNMARFVFMAMRRRNKKSHNR